jgi:predicted O-methyltransferase YrrM
MELHRLLGLARALRGTGNSRFLFPYVPGHYSSPLPDYRSVLANLANRSEADHELPGIDPAEEGQLELLRAFVGLYAEMPFPARPDGRLRYYYENGWFSPADATILYSMLRHYRPERVVEVGSGFSSALMLDVNDLFLKGVRFTFIEPYPQRLYGLFAEADRANNTVLEERVQDISLAVFETLRANDILFVDSSHVVKCGSDLGHILFEALPRLKSGVVVHFHDIFWPFEYPREWFSKGRAWNEAYFLRAFLQYNSAFRILYHSSFMAQRHTKVLERDLPFGLIEPSSLWLVKV